MAGRAALKEASLGRNAAELGNSGSGQQCRNIRAKSLDRVGLTIEEVSGGAR